MSNSYSTDWEAVENVDLIKEIAQQVWGGNAKFGEIIDTNSPYPEFEWSLQLYGKFNVNLHYDRSTLSIGVPTEEGYIALSRVADEHVFRGFDGMKPESLLHNFQVLDRLVRKKTN